MTGKCENCRYRDDPAGSDPCCSCFEASKWEARAMYEDLVKNLREATGWKKASIHYSLMNQAADAIEELSKVIQNHDFLESLINSHWIPVTERLPDSYEDVMLKFPNNQAAGFCDRDGCWSVYSGDGFYTEVGDNEPKPTHWMKKLLEP